ncbi:MAG: Fe-S protein assembly co-chaperone HscB [Bryobacteraceae bacterium]|nr:Fe-S protein assembly co-chaperone HscB [Bryobacteraceae bacterium]MCX7603678.1 Fe-S protein assembly co-chaperone HscB [Bryobacteraceae bacterium]
MRDFVLCLMAHVHDCWHCGAKDAASLFCRYCNTIQAPTPDYYEFFDLPRRLALDPEDLKNRYYTLSRLLHPDRYTRRSEQERRFSLEASSILNDAYRVLRDPIQRAEYVLREEGFPVGDQRNKDVPPELLEEVFELNMALDELRSGDLEVLPQLELFRRNFLDMLARIDEGLEELFRRHDAAEGDERRKILAEIRSTLNRRRYISNLVQEVDRQLAARNA